MSFYTSHDEQAKFDWLAFRLAYTLTLGREFALWAKQRRWCG